MTPEEITPYIDKLRGRGAELEAKLADPAIYAKADECRRISQEHRKLETLFSDCDAWVKSLKDLEENHAMLSSENDPELRELIAADRISFDKLINARIESLAYLYPDDPAAQAEVLCNMIMHRTELICHILHEAGILTD